MSAFSDTLAAGSALFSGWAAWTAHGVRKWQRDRDHERRQTRIAIEFQHAFYGGRDGGEQAMFSPDYALTVIVRNEGETTEYVSDIYIQEAKPDDAGPTGYHAWSAPPGEDRELRPRGRTSVTVTLDELRFDTTAGFVAIAHFASGTEIRSDVEHLVVFP